MSENLVVIVGVLLMIILPLGIDALHTQYEYHDVYAITDEGVIIEYNGELHLYDDIVPEDSEYVCGYYYIWEEKCPENYHITNGYRYWIKRG